MGPTPTPYPFPPSPTPYPFPPSRTTCSGDIGEAGKDITDAATQVVRMSARCPGHYSECSRATQALVKDIGMAHNSIAQAARDCAGQGQACTAAIQRIGDAIAHASTQADSIVRQCGRGKPAFLCVAACLNFGKTLTVSIGASFPQIIRSCRRHSMSSTFASADRIQ